VQVGNTFQVQVRDIKGCTVVSDSLWMPTPEKVEFTWKDLTCYGVEKPSLRISATGTEGRQFKVWYKQIEDQPVDAPYMEYNGWFDEMIVISDVFDFDNENFDDLHYAVYVEDDHGCVSMVDTLTFDEIQVPITVDWDVMNITECTQDLVVNNVYGGYGELTITLNDSIPLEVGETFTMPRGSHMLTVMGEHECVWEQMIDVEGMYVTRDTTINTYIDEETQFVFEEAGLDTMLAMGTYQFVYTVDCERTLNVTVVEVPRPYAIIDVQGEVETSPVAGKIAKVMGTVTGVASGEGFFVQDASAAWSGIWVEYTDVDTDGIKVGDAVSVVGEVAEVADVTTILATEVMMEGTAIVITPVEVTPSGAKAEMYESVLVVVPGARASAVDAGTGQWTIKYEETNIVTVNDWLYSSTPVEGDFYGVTGIVNGRLDAFKLEPRMESDIVHVPTKVDPEVANTFNVYPNPFNDRIYIDNNDLLTRAVITNIAGQRVIDVEYPEREIRTANLVSGVYLVNLFTKDGLAKTERIVKR
jgi:hypothetical protein